MIRNIVFDIGAVLKGWHADLTPFFGEEAGKAAAAAIWDSGLWKEMDRGLIEEEELLRRMIDQAPHQEREIRWFWDHMDRISEKYDYAIPWIRNLKKSGYQVYYLSNYSRRLRRQVPQTLGFLPLMDGGVFSCDVNLLKPDLEIYEYLLKKYGLVPEECLFIDDRQENIDGAIAAGLKGIRFDGYEQSGSIIQKFLKENGLSISPKPEETCSSESQKPEETCSSESQKPEETCSSESQKPEETCSSESQKPEETRSSEFKNSKETDSEISKISLKSLAYSRKTVPKTEMDNSDWKFVKRILVYGDSNTYGWDPRDFFGNPYKHPWPSLLAEYTGSKVISCGEPGREIPAADHQIRWLKEEIKKNAPLDLLIIMLGTNDLLNDPRPTAGAVSEKMERLLKSLLFDIGTTVPRILLLVPPTLELNESMYQKVSRELAVEYKILTDIYQIDFADASAQNLPLAFDGVHLTEAGHQQLAQWLAKKF